MNKLFSPSEARVPIGSVVIAGKSYEVTVNMEWARYFQSMNTAANTSAESIDQMRNALGGAAMSLASDGGGDGVEFVPGPAGPQGAQGAHGPVINLMSDDQDVEFLPGPTGPAGATGAQGPAIFILTEPDNTDIFWPIQAG